MTCADAICVLAQIGVLQFTSMVVVEGIAQAVAELQFWDQFEEGQI